MRHLVVFVVAALAGSAAAAPTVKVIERDVERSQIGYVGLTKPLAQSTAEPGGFEVPKDAAPEWLALGLMPGDIIRSTNGSPAGERLMFSEGVWLLELVRAGKPVILRVTLHGAAHRDVKLTDAEYQRLLGKLAPGIATPVQKGKTASGVRMLDVMLTWQVDLGVGDLVRTIDGAPIRTEAELITALRNLRVGTTDLVLERNGRSITVQMTRAAPLALAQIKKTGPTSYDVPDSVAQAVRDDIFLPTLKIKTAPTQNGVRVYDIEADSLCAALGLQNNDVILDIDGQSVIDFDHAYDTHAALEKATSITIHVERGAKKLALAYKLVP